MYKELIALRELIGEYREDTEKNYALRDIICQKIIDAGLEKDCKFEAGSKQGISFTVENAKLFSKSVIDRYFVQVYEYLQVLEQRLFSSGLHVLGDAPNEEQLRSYLEAYFDGELSEDAIDNVVTHKTVETQYIASPDKLTEAAEIANLLTKNTDEITTYCEV